MNPRRPTRDPWERLLEACTPARDHPRPGERAPTGFAARTVARWACARISPDATPWERLLTVAKAATASREQAGPATGSPFGFATRTAALWSAAQTEAPVLLWRRWSLRGLACSLGILILALATGSQQPPPGQELSLLPVPSLDVPNLSPGP